ncbi:MAG: DUF262 domain-containing HNH endonuclease family protein [Candidatus Omnitrophica bacterium]|nr:DUF262 domain-containing HNH endonuclease family protein [Candidatus Omnitrophota bacterium]
MKTGLTFEAKDKPIKEVLYANYRFRIPRYQRPYAWEEDQVAEFWNDLLTTEEPYFLGSLIFNHETLKKTGYIDIIDGQQRLLTIIIFSAALRNVARKIDPAFSALIQRKNIVIEDLEGSQNPIVEPGESIKDFFEKYIFPENSSIQKATPKTKEEKRICDNYNFFHEKLMLETSRHSNKQEKADCLKALRTKVQELIVIQIKIESEEDAYEIFETTNARGVDLSVADLLKNLIFKKIPAKPDKDFAKDVWYEITSNVQATNFEVKKFIRYYWLSKYAFISEKKLFRGIKKEITNYNDFIQDLWEASEAFNNLLEGSEEDWKDFVKDGEKVYKSVFAIRLMSVSQCHVFLMSLLRNKSKIKTNPNRVFKIIEKFTFSYSAICKLPGNAVEKIYSKFARELETVVMKSNEKKISGEVQAIFEKLIKELKDHVPSYELFKEKFFEVAYKNSEKNRCLIKYILERLNEALCETQEYDINFSKVNLEHILPQKPSKDWGLKKDKIKSYVNKLGNLTIIDKKINSKAQNKLVKDKFEFLEKSVLPINQKLVEELKSNNFKWGEEEINKRQDLLAKISYEQIWKI